MKRKKLIFLSYFYPPDQSAGSTRSELLIRELLKDKRSIRVWVLCSYSFKFLKSNRNIFKSKISKKISSNRLNILRIWIPYLGDNFFSKSISYTFYFFQVLILSILIRPNIVVATSAKLFTGFLGALISKFTNALFYLDLRDTFVDNYFYLFRFKKRIFFHFILTWVEKFTFTSCNSINLVSLGFKELLSNIDQLTIKKNISITNFTNGIDPKLKIKLQKINSNNLRSDNIFRVFYIGNLGEGQNLLGLINELSKDKKTIRKLIDNNIIFEIYGSGIQLSDIKNLLSLRNTSEEININNVIKYSGLVKKEKIYSLYKKANCLMLQLSKTKSIECVIPSKIFEYSSTDLPILFGASGFTYNFINKIEGTIPFTQLDAKSFYRGIMRSKKIKISKKKRFAFINKYVTTSIYQKYAMHILSD